MVFAACIVGSPAFEAKTEDEAIEALRALPWVRAGRGQKLKLPEPLVTLAASEKSLAEMVIEQRG